MKSLHTLLLSMQCALLDAVAPQLRAVTVDIDEKNKKLLMFFFYDGQVTPELFELASVAGTEASAALSEYLTDERIMQLDSPQKIPIQGKLAFLRKEAILPEYKKENRAFLLKQKLPLPVLLLDFQEALLGKVTPALRLACSGVDPDKKKLDFYFIYDGEISNEDFHLATLAIEEASVSFPGYKIISQIERIDFPNRMTSKGKISSYLRKETVL